MFMDLSSEPITKTNKEQFCVEMMERLDIQRRNEQFCDVILEVSSGNDQARLKAHRIVLCAASPFFYNALNSDMKEKKEGVIRLEETSKAVMEEVLEYLYTGHVDINEHDVFDLMVAADYFLIQSLKKIASNFILEVLSSSNCFFAYYTAKKYQWKKVEEGAKDFILANFEAVTKCEDFLKLSIEQVEEWISSDEITVCGEEKVFEAILRWFGGSIGHQQEFSKLLRHVRCVYLSRDYLFSVILSHPLVKENLECSNMVLNAMQLAFNGTEECFFSQSPRSCLKTHEDAIVICSHEKIECYIPSQNKWYALTDIPSERLFHRYTVSACHGKLYVIGGAFDDGNIAERYDPSVNSWVSAKAPKLATNWLATVTLQGFLYVVGGYDSSGRRLSTVQKYNPDTNLWHYVSSLSSPRSHVCAVADGCNLYAIGGINVNKQSLNIVERFDPRTNTWDRLPATLVARAGAGGAAIRQKVFVFGGLALQSSAADPAIEMYDSATNMWTSIPNEIAPRHFASVVSFKGKIYVFGAFQNEQSRKLQVYVTENSTWEKCSENHPLSGIGRVSCLRITRDVLATCTE